MKMAVVVGFAPIVPRAEAERCGGADFEEGVQCVERPTMETVFHGVRLVCCANQQCMFQVASRALVAIPAPKCEAPKNGAAPTPA